MKAHANAFTGNYTLSWRDAVPPDAGTPGGLRVGALRGCSWCGSMHPADLAEALRNGARLSWADRKYGWPHKAYLEGVPNPHAGLLEVRSSGGSYDEPDNDPKKVWSRRQDGRWEWHETPKPAAERTWGKFYTEHLQDAEPADADVIQKAMGLSFAFEEGGRVSWLPYSLAAQPKEV